MQMKKNDREILQKAQGNDPGLKLGHFKVIKVPADFECSITNEIMIDPVFTADGETYEREDIVKWLETHDTSPNTNEKLEHKKVTPNRKLKSQISEFIEANRGKF